MRTVVTVVLACAVIMMVCVPTTHAMKNSPDTPTADKVFQADKPVVADDGVWVDVKSGDYSGSIYDRIKTTFRIYLNSIFPPSSLTNSALEATQDYGKSIEPASSQSGSTSLR
jgi:hypothetical protein